MKTKLLTLLLLTVLLSACGKQTTENVSSPSASTFETELPSTQAELEQSELEAIGDIEVDKGLLDVEFTVPATYVGESTQADLDAEASEKGYKSVTLNSDGSATYKMSKSQHKKLMDDMGTELTNTLNEMIASEEFPNITDIKANDNFTEFTVTTKSTELDMGESFSVMAFYMYGGMYNIFSGDNVEEIKVDFINADTGEVIDSSSSLDMAE